MRKNFIAFLAAMILFPAFIISQSDSSPRNEVSTHFIHEGLGGNGISIRYVRKLKEQDALKFEFRMNAYNGFAIRMGYEILCMKWSKLELRIGADVKYEDVSIRGIDMFDFQKFCLEMPIEMRFSLSPKYFVQGGLSLEKRLKSNHTRYAVTGNEKEWRIGLGMKF